MPARGESERQSSMHVSRVAQIAADREVQIRGANADATRWPTSNAVCNHRRVSAVAIRLRTVGIA
jgi:hypothetical protein